MKKLLILVGLMTVMAGGVWLARAWSTWTVQARTSKQNADVDNLFAGLQSYKEHVGKYPVGSNSEIAKALMGQNPQKLIILVGRKNEFNDKGEFVDSWGTAFRMYFSDTGVLVRSAGPNRRFDDSTVIDCDDIFRSN